MYDDAARLADAQTFLTALFEHKPAESFLYLWTNTLVQGKSQGTRSHWFSDYTQALQAFKRLQRTKDDIYCGVAYSPQNYGANHRCKSAETVGFPGFWIDIDYLETPPPLYPDVKGHKKTALPKTASAAREWIESWPLQPSMIVDSGGGFHCWWLFDEPWIFADAAERIDAGELIQGWQVYLRQQAAMWGRAHDRDDTHPDGIAWTFDSTHDPARVLRVPGSRNWKYAGDVSAKLIACDLTLRYTPDDFRPYVAPVSPLFAPANTNGNGNHSNGNGHSAADTTVFSLRTESTATSGNAGLVPGKFLYTPDRMVRVDLLYALFAEMPRAESAFKRSRLVGDGSPSSYDCSLTFYAMRAGWDYQDIIDLLISARNLHHDELKLRDSYFLPTLNFVYEKLKERGDLPEKELLKAWQEQEPEAAEAETMKQSANTQEEERQQKLAWLSKQLKVHITRIVKYQQEGTAYRLETARGAVTLPKTDHLTSPTLFSNALVEAADIWVPLKRGPNWDKIVQTMLDVLVKEDIGPEATAAGMMRGSLDAYLSIRGIHPSKTEEAQDQQLPYYEPDGTLVIFAPQFRLWLNQTQPEKISAQVMGQRLHLIGAKPKYEPVKIAGQKTTKSTWRLPPSWRGVPIEDEEVLPVGAGAV